jgi:hypothetical protein
MSNSSTKRLKITTYNGNVTILNKRDGVTSGTIKIDDLPRSAISEIYRFSSHDLRRESKLNFEINLPAHGEVQSWMFANAKTYSDVLEHYGFK